MILKHTRFLGPDFSLHYQDIRIQNNVITDMQPSLQAEHEEEIVDCSGYLIYPPTLADCHVHTPDTLLRGGLFSDMSLHNWGGNETEQGRLQTYLFEYLDNSVGTPAFETLVLYAYLQYVKSGVGFIVETGQADESSGILEACAEKKLVSRHWLTGMTKRPTMNLPASIYNAVPIYQKKRTWMRKACWKQYIE